MPITRAARIVEDLVEDGRVRRAWVGAEVEPAGGEGPRRRQARVAAVVPGSPAERAGLQPGMLVLSVGSKRVRTPLDWEAGLLQGRVGEGIAVRVATDGGERTISITPADLPSVSAQRTQALQDFELITLTPAIQAERGLSNAQGALIASLSREAQQLGLRQGDLILQVNRARIATAEQAAEALRQFGPRGVVVYFERSGRVGSTQFRVG